MSQQCQAQRLVDVAWFSVEHQVYLVREVVVLAQHYFGAHAILSKVLRLMQVYDLFVQAKRDVYFYLDAAKDPALRVLAGQWFSLLGIPRSRVWLLYRAHSCTFLCVIPQHLCDERAFASARINNMCTAFSFSFPIMCAPHVAVRTPFTPVRIFSLQLAEPQSLRVHLKYMSLGLYALCTVDLHVPMHTCVRGRKHPLIPSHPGSLHRCRLRACTNGCIATHTWLFQLFLVHLQ